MATFQKLTPKELVALGKSPKSEQFRNLETNEVISKRQYQKQRQIGQYAAEETKEPKKQHFKKITPKKTVKRQGATVNTYVLTEPKARQLIEENTGKLGTIGIPLKINNKFGYAPSPSMLQATPHYSDTMHLTLENFDRVLNVVGDSRKLTSKFLVTVYE